MEKIEIKKRILDIQKGLHIKDSGMAMLMEVSVFTYKNCKSDLIDRNTFNLGNLENVLKNIEKKVKNICTM